MHFTKEEFDVMVYELLYKEPISFDMLCKIANKTLWSSVKTWCNNEACLRGRGHEEDIMQEIYIRLIKTTVNYFLLRDDVSGPYNNNPEGFEDWMFRVAKNIKNDFANKIRGIDIHTKELDDEISLREENYDFITDRLQNALNIVISSDVSIYKVLTWLAQYVFILNENIMKIESNDLILKAFQNKTLFDMYDMLVYSSKRIPWLALTAEQNEKILNALRKKTDNGVSYGETKYKDFFMKYMGMPSGKKSVSDWTNRLNDMVRDKENEQNQPKMPKKKCCKKKSEKTEKKG